ncbi:carbon-nitrogen hydrolase family protein [Nocardioides hungaricus]
MKQVRVAAVQAESVWLDLAGGIAKAVGLIEEAARGGAQLVAFGETWLPGYPWQIWLDSPAAAMAYVGRYHENSMSRDSEEMRALQNAAARNSIHVVIGFSERHRGSLYLAQAFIGNTGELLGVRRKLRPTHVERSLFGEGDGSDFQVHETSIGKLGALCCWEHIQPLNKHVMADLDEEIHVASWPAFCLYRGLAKALGAEVNVAESLSYAVETQSFVVAATTVVTEAAYVAFDCDTEEKRNLLQLGGGAARIFGPEGTMLADPLPETQEGIIYADLDPALRTIAKAAADPVGHYSRPDVYRLIVNRNPQRSVVEAGLVSTSQAQQDLSAVEQSPNETNEPVVAPGRAHEADPVVHAG